MEVISDDNSIKTFLSKYPIHEQSIVATKLTRIGIKYIIKTTSSFHPPTLKELDNIIYQLALPRPAKDDPWIQPIQTKQIPSPKGMLIVSLLLDQNAINQCPTFGKKKKEEKKRAHTYDNRQTKGVNCIKKKGSQQKYQKNMNVCKETKQINQNKNQCFPANIDRMIINNKKDNQQSQHQIKNNYQINQPFKLTQSNQQTQISTQSQAKLQESIQPKIFTKTDKLNPTIQTKIEPIQSQYLNQSNNQPIELTKNQNMSIDTKTSKVETPQSIKKMDNNNNNNIYHQNHTLNTQENTSNYHYKDSPIQPENNISVEEKLITSHNEKNNQEKGKTTQVKEQQQPAKANNFESKTIITQQQEQQKQQQSNPIMTEPSEKNEKLLNYDNYPISTEPNLASSNCYSFRESIFPYHCHCSRHSYYCHTQCYCYDLSHSHQNNTLPSYLRSDTEPEYNPSKTQYSLRKFKSGNKTENSLSTSQYVSKSGITYEFSPRYSSYY